MRGTAHPGQNRRRRSEQANLCCDSTTRQRCLDDGVARVVLKKNVHNVRGQGGGQKRGTRTTFAVVHLRVVRSIPFSNGSSHWEVFIHHLPTVFWWLDSITVIININEESVDSVWLAVMRQLGRWWCL